MIKKIAPLIGIPLRFYLIPFTVFLIMGGGGNVSFIPHFLWTIPKLLASPFPTYFSAAGVPIRVLVGDIMLLVVFVLVIMVRTPELKLLGLGKNSGGRYWKGGRIPYWFVALYLIITVSIGFNVQRNNTDVYTGHFTAVRSDAPNVRPEALLVYYQNNDLLIQEEKLLTIRFENFRECRFEVSAKELDLTILSPGSRNISRTPDYKTVFADFGNRDGEDGCELVTFRMTSPHQGTMRLANGHVYVLERRMDLTPWTKKGWVEERFDHYLEVAASDYRETELK